MTDDLEVEIDVEDAAAPRPRRSHLARICGYMALGAATAVVVSVEAPLTVTFPVVWILGYLARVMLDADDPRRATARPRSAGRVLVNRPHEQGPRFALGGRNKPTPGSPSDRPR